MDIFFSNTIKNDPVISYCHTSHLFDCTHLEQHIGVLVCYPVKRQMSTHTATGRVRHGSGHHKRNLGAKIFTTAVNCPFAGRSKQAFEQPHTWPHSRIHWIGGISYYEDYIRYYVTLSRRFIKIVDFFRFVENRFARTKKPFNLCVNRLCRF